MVLNVDQFRKQLSGGGARANLFSVELNAPAFGLSAGNLGEVSNFLVKTAEIPGSTITPIIIPFRGRQVKISGDRTFDPWTVTILNDVDFKIRNALEEWMFKMNNHADNDGVANPIEYEAQLNVKQLTRSGGSTTGGAGGVATESKDLTWTFVGAWPSDLGPISVSYDNENQIEEYQVTFQYQYWTSSRTDQPA